MAGTTFAPIGLETTPLGDQVMKKRARETRPRYDMVILAGGTTPPNPINFFVAPLGSVGLGIPVKTEAHTNQVLVQQLESGVAINAYCIEVAIYSVGNARNGDSVMRRIASMWEQAYLRLRVSETVELEARLNEFAQGSGMSGIPPMTSPAPRTYLSIAPTIRGIRTLRRTIGIAVSELFEFELFLNGNAPFVTGEIPFGDDIGICATIYGKTSRKLD